MRRLTRALMAKDFRAPHSETEAITDGIDISTWTVRSEQVDLQYSVWDFAGQTVYYNTHQFFLSNRALYLLVWNTRLGYEHSGLDFWLSSIACHCPKAPVFIVGTHADKVTHQTSHSKQNIGTHADKFKCRRHPLYFITSLFCFRSRNRNYRRSACAERTRTLPVSSR